MNKNVKIAKQLVRIAKMLVSEDTSFNPSSSNAGDDIESMSKDEKINLAKNKNASPEILKKLAEDEDWAVRETVAKNPGTPVEILRKLAFDEDEHVGKAVAINLSTTFDILKEQAEDEDANVRETVAENPRTPDDILRKLALDEDVHVSKAAERALRKRGL